jgi:hypothetical protein
MSMQNSGNLSVTEQIAIRYSIIDHRIVNKQSFPIFGISKFTEILNIFMTFFAKIGKIVVPILASI